LPNSLKAGNYLVKVEGKGSLMVEKFVYELWVMSYKLWVMSYELWVFELQVMS
jgi:hypothetical protein